jgi:hypothetical protein
MKSALCSRFAAVLLLILLGIAPARATVYWRVSVKIILDANGDGPTATNEFNYSTEARIRQEFEEYNKLLGRMGWGYKLQLTEVLRLSGISQWFNVNARDGEQRAELEIQAKLHPGQYAYRPNALNIYVNNTSSGTSGGHLPLIGDVIFAGANGYWSLLLHEIGHGMGLCHTHGCDCNDGCVGLTDNIADTIGDSDSWTSSNQVANFNFGLPYNSLNANQRLQVDNVWKNIMSYHNDDGGTTNRLDRFTHDQWERMVDVSNFEKRNIASGKSVFVDRQSSGLSPCELFSRIASLTESLPGPSSWYVDALNASPPPPEAFFRRNCQNFAVDPPFPPRPPGYPNEWPWPPTVAFPDPPPGYPNDWPWPPINPEAFTVCIGGYKTVRDAINCGAQSGDRLQIKAGNYNETIRITQPVTLSTDRGRVTIGRP